ncbi:MAG: 2-oxoglutarate dehydrogenase, E2 component, dihydrolipoamide succinyltransferase, partial [Actinomycetales bacterium]|nr:2-oxoglutarate dehydrogenase, E2 component, dihydrolipoamide succinyltransferase [Actinomycetales bacterium]
MSDTVQMPALGESVTEGTVTRWLKQVGDTVEVDEPLLEVSTDKVDTEIPSPVAGTLLEILVGEDETVEVGAPLARIGSPDEAGGDQPAADGAAQPADQPAAAESPDAAQVPEEVTEEPAAAPAQEAAPAAEPDAAPAAEEPAPAQAAPAAGGATEDVTMPALGESVTEGTVTRWLKAVGDTVEVDEPLLEVSTDKVDTEIPSPVAGTIVEIVVGEDDTVGVGAVLARVGAAGAAPATGAPEPEAPARDAAEEAEADVAASAAPDEERPQGAEPVSGPTDAEAQEPPAQQAPAAAPAEAPAERPSAPAQQATGGGYLTPLVRKLAAEKGVDLSTVTGTGV